MLVMPKDRCEDVSWDRALMHDESCVCLDHHVRGTDKTMTADRPLSGETVRLWTDLCHGADLRRGLHARGALTVKAAGQQLNGAGKKRILIPEGPQSPTDHHRTDCRCRGDSVGIGLSFVAGDFDFFGGTFFKR